MKPPAADQPPPDQSRRRRLAGLGFQLPAHPGRGGPARRWSGEPALDHRPDEIDR
jgi:hypothetical protein